MKAPFCYFGAKSMVASDVWEALGQPAHYIEPFCGSCAVLLNRPNWQPGMVESVNDRDAFLANVWRALQADPDGVAKFADWPVNHADLMSRRRFLLANEGRLLENLIASDEWYNAKCAGYWIWAASCWIGSGLTRPNAIPHIIDGGKGVHAAGQIPHIAHGGNGVHAAGPIEPGDGPDVRDPYNVNIYRWFRQLSERLRYVRVVCGDWKQVCGGDWQDRMGTVGIFFDPPYGVTDRDTDVYHHDSTEIAADVMAWCAERGGRESYRIVLAGYEEYQELVDKHGWTFKTWKAQGGYGNQVRNEDSKAIGKSNRHRERLYFSPHCCGKGLF